MLDVIDTNRAFSADLKAHGIRNQLVRLYDPTSTHTPLAPADVALLVDLAMRRRPPERTHGSPGRLAPTGASSC